MLDEYLGVATFLKQNIHCLKVKLHVKNSVDSVNAVSHFRTFVDALYKVNSFVSKKNRKELQIVADVMSIDLMTVFKLFDVRWVFSSFVALRALLRDSPALFVRFNESSSEKTSKETSRYHGHAKKLVIVSRLYAKRCIALFEAAVEVYTA